MGLIPTVESLLRGSPLSLLLSLVEPHAETARGRGAPVGRPAVAYAVPYRVDIALLRRGGRADDGGACVSPWVSRVCLRILHLESLRTRGEDVSAGWKSAAPWLLCAQGCRCYVSGRNVQTADLWLVGVAQRGSVTHSTAMARWLFLGSPFVPVTYVILLGASWAQPRTAQRTLTGQVNHPQRYIHEKPTAGQLE